MVEDRGGVLDPRPLRHQGRDRRCGQRIIASWMADPGSGIMRRPLQHIEIEALHDASDVHTLGHPDDQIAGKHGALTVASWLSGQVQHRPGLGAAEAFNLADPGLVSLRLRCGYRQPHSQRAGTGSAGQRTPCCQHLLLDQPATRTADEFHLVLGHLIG